MKKLLLILVLISISIYGKSQTDIKNITDSTIVVGLVIEDCYADSYNVNEDNKMLIKGTTVIVNGAETYRGEKVFDISYKGKRYYIAKYKLFIKDYTFEDISAMDSITAEKFRDHSIYLGIILRKSEIEKVFRVLNGCKPYGLAIYDWSYYDESEYTEGTSAKVTVYNPTGKTIKYIWFSFIGYNPVGDRVIENRAKGAVITRKAVGPIAKGDTGTYQFEYLWFTDMVETAKISSIKVMYMDGTQKVITNPKLVTLSNEYRSIIED
jgi:hypothetical protein